MQKKFREPKAGLYQRSRGWRFRVHEELDASDVAQSFGFLFDGKRAIVQPIPEKLAKVQAAFRWHFKAWGKDVERLLGRATHLMMLRMELLSLFRCLYDFVQGCYNTRSRLRPAAVREARWACSLFGLCSVDLRMPWSPYQISLPLMPACQA